MSKKQKMFAIGLLVGAALLVLVYFVAGQDIAVLSPEGQIATQQRNLILFTTLLSLIVVVPVFAMTFVIAWKYRAKNTKAEYKPDWDHSRIAETIWWTVPTVLILILAVVTWKSSHDLDPFKPIASANPELTVQVVALDWKWLFIYPEQQIATINYVEFPEQTPIKFMITADAPMNSFWIPQLGGQIYAMSGMSTHLNLIADSTGRYRGSSANISGRGFANMNFTARSSTQKGFQEWVQSVRQQGGNLDQTEYDKLVRPSEDYPATSYALADPNLFDSLISKYNVPSQRQTYAQQEAL